MADGLTLASYAAAKQLSVEFLRGLGVTEITVDGSPALRIPYRDEDGVEIAVRLRLALTGDRFRWRSGSKPRPYGLDRLASARAAGFTLVVEGESDCHVLWHHELPALGLPGATSGRDGIAAALNGITTVYALVEPDAGGAALVTWLATSSFKDRVKLVHLAGAKDVSELHVADPLKFKMQLLCALDAAEPYRTVEDAKRTDEAAQALALAQPLLDDPALLDRVADAIRAGGFAGDVRPALLAYLAITSRLLPRPLNLAFVAPSAAGKNRAVDAAVALVPPDAVHLMGAGTARALVYSEKDFQHTTVIVEEADSLPDEGPAASAVRAIAERNGMKYETVERDERTGKFTTRTVAKPGPTGIITTSCTSLREQLGTRHLEVSVADDAEQTRAVLRAHAAARAGTSGPPPDRTALLAVQSWLALAGARDVVVPFAPALADLVPANEVRMRRDFAQLLTAVQAVALLHQRHRDRTPTGAVIATIGDYAVARDWLASVFAAIAAGGATPVVRQTIEAVGPNEAVTRAELVSRLGCSARTVSWRVRKALRGGWLVEEREKGSRVLRRGTPLPTETTALPDPALLSGNSATASGGEEDHPSPPPPGGVPEEEGGRGGLSLPKRELPSCREPGCDDGDPASCVDCGAPGGAGFGSNGETWCSFHWQRRCL